MADRLNKISATAKLDAVLNGSGDADLDTNIDTKRTMEASTAGNTYAAKSSSKPKSSKSKSLTTKPESSKKLEKLKKLKHMQEKLIKQQKTELNSQEANVKNGEAASSDADIRSNVLQKIDSKLISELHKITSQLITSSGGSTSKRARPNASPNTTTKNEISKVRNVYLFFAGA